jgi:hypothetical protein
MMGEEIRRNPGELQQFHWCAIGSDQLVDDGQPRRVTKGGMPGSSDVHAATGHSRERYNSASTESISGD